VNPATIHLSASSIASFKACPQRFRLAYREGLRSAKDTDSQRQGTNWHAMHERHAEALSVADQVGPMEDVPGFALNAVIVLLNEKYNQVPTFKTPVEWETERQVLLNSFIGYLWYWQNDPVEVLASEVPFELPLRNPKVGLDMPISEAVRVGKIDHVIKWHGAVCALERKSTSRGIGPDSDYWEKSQKDTQVSMYALAFRDLMHGGMGGGIGGDIAVKLAMSGAERFGNTLYDVWHKPTIKPAMLTQKDTLAFAQTGEYQGQTFIVACTEDDASGNITYFSVNGIACEVEQGKKGFAIRETPQMFGARLLQDIYERPDFYFQRREIARTDAEIRGFQDQLWAVYQSQRAYIRNGCWFENESQCRATYACPYIPICYGVGADAVCDGRTTPDGFKRIFVDLTVNGQEIEE
jgi:hypothetical protein